MSAGTEQLAQVFLAAPREIAATAAGVIDQAIDEREPALARLGARAAEILLDGSADQGRPRHTGLRGDLLDRLDEMRG
jgi:hypothetical protein